MSVENLGKYAQKGVMTGKKNPFYGKEHSEEWKENMTGENNPNWKGGSVDIARKRKKTREWKKRNKERVNFLNKRRQARRRNAEGSHTFKEWKKIKKEYNYCCPACNKCEPDIILTQDHIIPLSRGGSDNIENIQPLCKSCNSKKRTKIIKYESQ